MPNPNLAPPEPDSKSMLWDELASWKLNLSDIRLRKLHERELRSYGWFVSLLPFSPGDFVVDCGCGDGFLSVELARRGAIVTGFDVSEEALAVASRRAQLFGVSERTSFVSESFDSFSGSGYALVCGIFILHHVDTEIAAQRISNWLNPGNKGIFLENSTDNQVLMWIRRNIVHKRRLGLRPLQEDVEEQPLSPERVEAMLPYFSQVSLTHPEFMFWRQGYRCFQIVLPKSLEPRLIPMLIDGLALMDKATFLLFPPLRRFSWWTLVELQS